VESVLRSIDRGFYFANEDKHLAYQDIAYQSGHIHLSAPGVYAAVLENLGLQSGHKFLNIGSGIGLLSTVAGLLLGKCLNIYIFAFKSKNPFQIIIKIIFCRACMGLYLFIIAYTWVLFVFFVYF